MAIKTGAVLGVQGMNKLSRDIGENLKAMRTKTGYTQMQVYVRTGIAQNTLSNYETGERLPSMYRLIALAKCYHCKLSDFLPQYER